MIATAYAIALSCLSLNVYHEARNQSVQGQQAVALVTMNRAGWDNKNICPEVVKRKQFSWTTEYVYKASNHYKLRKAGIPKETKAWKKSVAIAKKVMKGKVPDFTKGATYYHTTAVLPYWSSHKKQTITLGEHVFYKDKENS